LRSPTPPQPSDQTPLSDGVTKPVGFALTTEFFGYLFDISRHIAHGVETTQIATEVVERMRIACEFLTLAHLDPILRARAVQKLNFLHGILRGLYARSVSTEKRLTSEQTLVSSIASFGKAKIPATANSGVNTSSPI
jgi:hypothetical protein